MTNKEIDRLIAEKFMGWVQGTCNGDPMLIPPEYLETIDELKFVLQPPEDYYLTSFHPSTDIRDAWKVVEKLSYGKVDDSSFKLENFFEGYWATFFKSDRYFHSGQQKTAPMAICLAALKSVGMEVPE